MYTPTAQEKKLRELNILGRIPEPISFHKDRVVIGGCGVENAPREAKERKLLEIF